MTSTIPLPGSTSITHLVIALLIAIAAFIIGSRIRNHTVRIARRGARIDASLALLLGRILYATILIIGGLWILNLFNISIVSILTVLGVVGLAISLALQDVLRNLFAGIYLLIERPFTIGDYIELTSMGALGGIIENIDLRLTIIRTIEGTRLIIPNSSIFNAIVANRTIASYRCWALHLTVPPDMADHNQVAATIAAVAQSLDSAAPLPTTVLEALSSQGAVFSINIWSQPHATPTPAMIALHQQFPRAIITLPNAPPIPTPAAPPTPSIPRPTPHHPTRTTPTSRKA